MCSGEMFGWSTRELCYVRIEDIIYCALEQEHMCLLFSFIYKITSLSTHELPESALYA